MENCPILNPKLLEKKARGFYDQCIDSLDRVTVVGWNDNKSAYIASNAISSSLSASVCHCCKEQQKSVKVDQPCLINLYSKNMGGVDRCDHNTSNYCISMRSKKWWWALFAWIPDMVVQNCWLLYRENKKVEDPTFDLLAFRRQIFKRI